VTPSLGVLQVALDVEVDLLQLLDEVGVRLA